MNSRTLLLVLLLASLVAQVFLFPFSGLETRTASQFTPSQFVFDASLGVVIFILNLVAFPLVWKRPVWGVRSAIILGWLALIFSLADITALLGPSPPAGFATAEALLSVIAILIIVFAYSRRKVLVQATPGMSQTPS